VLTLGRVVAVLVAVKAVDVAARGALALPAALWVLSLALLLTGAAVLAFGRETVGWAGVLAGCVLAAVDFPGDLRRQHLVLLLAVAAVGLVARDDGERLLLLRVQVSALYGTAALAKLNASFLGGDVLGLAVRDAPFGTGLLGVPPTPVLLAGSLGLVAVEALLAAAPWWRRLHLPALLLALPVAGVDAGVTLRLVVFGGTSMALLCAVTGRLRLAPDHQAGSSRETVRHGGRLASTRARAELRRRP
jgi:hypothetical protein